MGAIQDLSDFISRATGGSGGSPETLDFFKDNRIAGAAAPATIAGRAHSLWLNDGNPGPGAAPGAWANPDNTTNGGLFQTDPGGGREKWLTYGWYGGLVQGGLLIYDRLGHNSGLLGNDVNAQTFTGTITRNTTGVGNRIWIEIYTIIGTTATTVTAEYTDQDGNPSQVTVATAIGGTGNREVSRVIELPLASGDYGVQEVANVDLLATTGTAGSFGVTIARPLIYIPGELVGVGGDLACLAEGVGPIKCDTGACLGMLWIANGTTAPQLRGQVFSLEA